MVPWLNIYALFSRSFPMLKNVADCKEKNTFYKWRKLLGVAIHKILRPDCNKTSSHWYASFSLFEIYMLKKNPAN